jgi:hypothetical protein
MTTKDYQELVAQAEAAVASIKDSDLKGTAFGKILHTLLGRGSSANNQERSSSDKGAAPRKGGNKVAKSGKRKGGPKGYVEELIEENFFRTPKTLAAIREDYTC